MKVIQQVALGNEITDLYVSTLLEIQPGITAIVGSGGKTTLMMTVARELSERGTVIISTSTKIFPPAMVPVSSGACESELRNSLCMTPVVCVAANHSGGKLTAPNCSFDRLAELADFVLVEADGSKGLPLKAHASYEPVIPKESGQIICVVGADGFYRPLREVCHRPEIFSGLAGISVDSVATPAHVAQVIEKEGYAHKILINKVESMQDMKYARSFAVKSSLPVFAGSLKKGVLQCLS